MPNQTADSPDYVLPIVATMRTRWQTIDDVSGGHETVTAATTKYLPKEPDEKQASYDLRLSKAIWYDAFNQTVDGITGIAFSTQPMLGDDVPKQISEMAENANMVGDHLNVVGKSWFDGALRKGIMYALVDMPEFNEQVRSLADQRRLGIRPYVKLIDAKDVISWRYDVVAGQIVLTQAVIAETVSEPDGVFGSSNVEQWRVLRPGAWEIWRKDKKGDVFIYQEGTTSLNRIALVPLDLDKKSGFMMAKPPLMGLAQLNIAHYQIYTDTRHSAHIASVPMFSATGIDKDEFGKVTISANVAMVSERPDAQFGWISYDGAGVNLNRELMQDIERQMSVIGLSILSDNDTEVTAYEKSIDTAQSQSKLYSWVMAYKDAMENVLQLMAEFMGEKSGGTYQVNDDMLMQPLSAEEMARYSDMVGKGQMTLRTMFKMLQQGKRLPADFDIDVEIDELESETGGVMTGDE